MSSNTQGLKRILLGLVVGLWVSFWGTAAASLSLADLINDHQTFSSLNDEVHFAHFELLSTDVDELLLEEYAVVPHELGFWLYSPQYSVADPGTIAISYSAQATAGLLIDILRLSFTGLEDAPMVGHAEMDVRNASGDLLAALEVTITGELVEKYGPNGYDRYDADLQPISPTAEVWIDDWTTGGEPLGDWRTSHKFYTAPVPEPTTALLLGLGLVGLGYANRRRS